MDRDEERRIIAQVCAGDANAFEALVVAYQKQVYNLALRTVGSEEDAADMTQEVFLRAYRALGTFRGESKFSVWLYRLTTNVCIDFLRSRRRHPTALYGVCVFMGIIVFFTKKARPRRFTCFSRHRRMYYIIFFLYFQPVGANLQFVYNISGAFCPFYALFHRHRVRRAAFSRGPHPHRCTRSSPTG